MTHVEAERVIERAVADDDDFVALTTSPSARQQEAIGALVLTGEAPAVIRHAFGLDALSTWAEVVRAIAIRRGEFLGALSAGRRVAGWVDGERSTRGGLHQL